MTIQPSDLPNFFYVPRFGTKTIPYYVCFWILLVVSNLAYSHMFLYDYFRSRGCYNSCFCTLCF